MADALRSETYRQIVHNLRKVREDAGVHQATLARLLGKGQSYISRIENAERRLGILDLLAISSALDMEPADLFARITRDAPENFKL